MDSNLAELSRTLPVLGPNFVEIDDIHPDSFRHSPTSAKVCPLYVGIVSQT